MSQKSSLYRTIEILKDLNDGKKLCVSNLATAYEVSDRTIRRDFELIKELFGDFMSKDGECYQAYSKILLEDVLSATDLITLANIVNLFGITAKQSAISDKTKCLIEKSMEVYSFQSRPLENMQNREVLKQLEHAIKFNKEIKIIYHNERVKTQRRYHPYRILFVNENFYLVGENISMNRFEFLRISMIVKVISDKRIFYPHKDINAFIERIQSPFSTFGKKEILVRLRVIKDVRRYFLFKKYLPSQEIAQTYENGDIEIHYRVTNIREVEELIIKWLPHVQILAPRGLNKRLKKTLSKKMMSLNPKL